MALDAHNVPNTPSGVSTLKPSNNKWYLSFAVATRLLSVALRLVSWKFDSWYSKDWCQRPAILATKCWLSPCGKLNAALDVRPRRIPLAAMQVSLPVGCECCFLGVRPSEHPNPH